MDLTKQQLEGPPIWLQLAGNAGKGDDGDDWGELEVALWLGPKGHVLGRISEDQSSEPDGLPVLMENALASNPVRACGALWCLMSGNFRSRALQLSPKEPILGEIGMGLSGVQGLLCPMSELS